MQNLLKSDLNHILNHTQRLWHELEGKRIFITGGTGFFGCWLLESLVWAIDTLGIQIDALILTRSVKAFQKKAPHLANHSALSFWVGDVRSFDFPEGEFSHIIHAATEVNPKQNIDEPLVMFDTIVEGTRHTLEFARSCSAEKFLLISSGAAYGKQLEDMPCISESYSGAPDTCLATSAYGEGKRSAELLCNIYSHLFGFETKIARCFAFSGPYMSLSSQFAIASFMRDLLNGGPICVEGTGQSFRSYLYASDLAIWLWTILFCGTSRSLYNVGSDQAVTIVEVATKLASLHRIKPCEVQIKNNNQIAFSVDHYIPNIEKARQELGLDVWVEMIKGFKKSYQWYSRMHS